MQTAVPRCPGWGRGGDRVDPGSSAPCPCQRGDQRHVHGQRGGDRDSRRGLQVGSLRLFWLHVCDLSALDWAQKDNVSSLPNAHNLHIRFNIMQSGFISVFSQPTSRAQVLHGAQILEGFLLPATNSHPVLLFGRTIYRFYVWHTVFIYAPVFFCRM